MNICANSANAITIIAFDKLVDEAWMQLKKKIIQSIAEQNLHGKKYTCIPFYKKENFTKLLALISQFCLWWFFF
jgi:hypothetical protein